MSDRSIISLIAVLLLSFVLGGGAVWLLTSARTPAKHAITPPSGPQAEDPVDHGRAEKFFGGDLDRNIRGGQEMKPRW